MTTFRTRIFVVAAVWYLTASLSQASMVFNKTYTSSPGNPSSELTTINSILGTSLTYLDKWDGEYGEWEEDGDFDLESYVTVDQPSGDESASISWDLSGTGYILEAILLKDGNGANLSPTPEDLGGNQLYTLYTVSSDQYTIGGSTNLPNGLAEFFHDSNMTNAYDKGISHITFFGDAAPTPEPVIPEPGTIAIWGVLLGIGLLFVKRRK